jgi:hypothetical protein
MTDAWLVGLCCVVFGGAGIIWLLANPNRLRRP